MEFYIYSRQAIEAIPPHDVGHLIISIRTPGDPEAVRLPLNEFTRGVLHLQFHDLDVFSPDVEAALQRTGELERVRPFLFNDDMGMQVVRFVKEHLARPESIERILVHCDAGWSRSPGVAAALALTVFDDADTEKRIFKRYTPNRRVYRSILNAFSQSIETDASTAASVPEHPPTK